MRTRTMLQSTKLSLGLSFEQNPRGVSLLRTPPAVPQSVVVSSFVTSPQRCCKRDAGKSVQIPRRRCVTVGSSLQHSPIGEAPVEQTSWAISHQYEVFRKVGEVLYKNLSFSYRGCLSSQDSFMSLCSAEGNKELTVPSAG